MIVARISIPPGLEPTFAGVAQALDRAELEWGRGSREGRSAEALELVIDAKQCGAVRRALSEIGFARLPASFLDGTLRFVGYREVGGGWVHLTVRMRDRYSAIGLALADRLWGPVRRRGLGVALLGPDGAGKSSMIEAVARQFFTPVYAIYMGLYQGEQPNRRRPRLPGLGLTANLARQQWRWLTGVYQRLRGRLVLFDRYTHDALLSPERPLTWSERLRRRLLAAACPAPDLIVILDAPAEVLFERKGEHDTALLDRHRRRFLELHRDLPDSVVIDTSGRPEDAVHDLIAAIWSVYAGRWR